MADGADGRGAACRGLRSRPRGGPARARPAAVRRAGPRRPRPRRRAGSSRWRPARARRSPRSRPSSSSALAGRGAHVLTFNDYLARRDAAWMGPVYERLGLCGRLRAGADERRRAAAGLRRRRHVRHREGGGLRPPPRRARASSRPTSCSAVPLRPRGRGRLDPDRRGPRPARDRGRERARRSPGRSGSPRSCAPSRPGVDFDTDEHAHNIALTEAGAATRRGGPRLRQPPRAREPVAPRAAAPRPPRRAPPPARRGLHRAGRARSSWWTSRPAAWPTGATGRTGSTPRSRPRRACGSRRRAGSSGQVTLQHFLRLYPQPRRHDRHRPDRGRGARGVLRPAHGA